MAKLRLKAVKDIPLIEPNDDAQKLAAEILRRGLLPPKADVDAAHIAVSCIHGINYLLSLNFRHIANPFSYVRISETCKEFGFNPPIICTLEQILEKENRLND